MNKPILITGSHRSGTTFVGKILSLPSSVAYVSEPFNKESGVYGVNHWYPYINSDNLNQLHYINIVEKILNFKGKHKNPPLNTDVYIKKVTKKLIGNKKMFYYRKAKLFSRLPGKIGKRLLIKDPLAAFLSDFLAQKHNFKVLVLVRHPCAFYVSLKRLGWRFNFKDFLEQDELIENHLKDFVYLMEKKNKSFEEEAGLLWCCIYKVLEDYRKENPDWLFIKHEDICMEPLKIFRKIFDWAGLEFSNRIENKIRFFTEGRSVKAENNKAHQLERDSKGVANYWKSIISNDEVDTIKDLIFRASTRYYRDNSWVL